MKHVTIKHIRIGTHGGDFHPDEIGGVAIIKLVHPDCSIEIYRTRDEEVLKQMDYLVDVGGVHDGERFFDHHQPGGAGKRNDGIPYASFGLVWKKFGPGLCNSVSVFNSIDKIFISEIDAIDNGVGLEGRDATMSNTAIPFFTIVNAYRKQVHEDESVADENFLELVDILAKAIERSIARLKSEIDDATYVEECYALAADKRIILLEGTCHWENILRKYPEPIYAVFPKDGSWRVMTVEDFHVKRKSLPEKWAGLPKEELARVTGVEDVVFCHKNLFVVVAESRKGAIALAKLALNS